MQSFKSSLENQYFGTFALRTIWNTILSSMKLIWWSFGLFSHLETHGLGTEWSPLLPWSKQETNARKKDCGYFQIQIHWSFSDCEYSLSFVCDMRGVICLWPHFANGQSFKQNSHVFCWRARASTSRRVRDSFARIYQDRKSTNVEWVWNLTFAASPLIGQKSCTLSKIVTTFEQLKEQIIWL